LNYNLLLIYNLLLFDTFNMFGQISLTQKGKNEEKNYKCFNICLVYYVFRKSQHFLEKEKLMQSLVNSKND